MITKAQVRHLRRGFSLLEIIIAVALIGLLMTFIGPNLMNVLGKGKKTTAQAALRAYKMSIEQFHEATGTYPKQLTDLYQRPSDPKVAKDWEHEYMSQRDVERRDPWKQEYQYEVTPRGPHPYELYSWGGNAGENEPEEKRLSVWDL